MQEVKLFKGMFGEETPGVKRSNQFGLQYGQRRRENIAHNAGWFNMRGELLGWGDLDNRDFQEIRLGMDPYEIFVIVHETGFDKVRRGIPDPEDIGMDRLIDHAWLIITPKQYYFVPHRGNRGTEKRQGIVFKIIGREKARKIILNANKTVIHKTVINQVFIKKIQMVDLVDCVGEEVTVIETKNGERSQTKGNLDSVIPFEMVVVRGKRMALTGIDGVIEQIFCGKKCVYSNEILRQDTPGVSAR